MLLVNSWFEFFDRVFEEPFQSHAVVAELNNIVDFFGKLGKGVLGWVGEENLGGVRGRAGD